MRKRAQLFIVGFGLAVLFSQTVSAQWVRTNGTRGGYIYSIAVGNTGVLFAGTDSGVFRSTNNGTDWAMVDSGLTDSTVYSIAVTGTGGLYAGTYY